MIAGERPNETNYLFLFITTMVPFVFLLYRYVGARVKEWWSEDNDGED